MPDTRLAKARATLPVGYRFGDAGPCESCHGQPALGHVCRVCGLSGTVPGLSAMTLPLTGPGADYRDQHAAAVDRSHDANAAGPMLCRHGDGIRRYDPSFAAYVCQCGAVLDEFDVVIGRWKQS